MKSTKYVFLFTNIIHKCIFCQMTKEAIKMAVEILLNQGSLPSTEADFEEKSNELVKIIIKKNWHVR